MKQLINYKLTNNTMEEYVEVKLLIDREVLVEIPICLIEFGRIYDKAYIPQGTKEVAVALTQQELDELLKTTKIFKLKVEGNQVTENENEYDLAIRLPLNTKVNELVYESGQLLWAKPIEEKEGDR